MRGAAEAAQDGDPRETWQTNAVVLYDLFVGPSIIISIIIIIFIIIVVVVVVVRPLRRALPHFTSCIIYNMY